MFKRRTKLSPKEPKKMITKAQSTIYGKEIYCNIGWSYDFIEAIVSSLIHPDYSYKRFPCTFEGYKEAHKWVFNKAKEMLNFRTYTLHLVNGKNGTKSNYITKNATRCYDWNTENIKNMDKMFEIDIY